MTEFDVVQIISLLGFLILAVTALASHKLEWKRGIVMMLIWATIFAAVTLLFSLVS